MRLALHWQILIAMLLGAVVGIAANALGGRFTMPQPMPLEPMALQPYGFAEAVEVAPGWLWTRDSPDVIQIQHDRQSDGQLVRLRFVVAAPGTEPADWPPSPVPDEQVRETRQVEVASLSQLRRSDSQAYVLFHTFGRSTARRLGDAAQALGDLFLRMLRMVSVPLIITSLVAGITSLGATARLGRMFGRTLGYYVCTSMLAIFIGLFMVNLIRPGGRDISLQGPPARDPGAVLREGKSLGAVLFEQVENLIPPNPVAAVAEGNFLSIISFSLLLGIFTLLVGGEAGRRIQELFGALFEVMMALTMAIIRLAPIGVLALMLSATATQGIGIFGALGLYMLTVFLGLVLHAVVVLPLIVHFVGRRNPWQFAKAMSPALFTAFSSASSNGTLPLTLSCVENRAGISNRVGSFVLPLGATVNMDGTALYEVVAVLFIAQITPNIELTLAQQVIVALTALLASIGAAGIPHAGLVMMIIILQAVGLPTASQGLIIAVDRILDMCRTSVNVWSDACGCAVVARFENFGSHDSPADSSDTSHRQPPAHAAPPPDPSLPKGH